MAKPKYILINGDNAYVAFENPTTGKEILVIDREVDIQQGLKIYEANENGVWIKKEDIDLLDFFLSILPDNRKSNNLEEREKEND